MDYRLIQGGVEILIVALCYRSRDMLRRYGTLSLRQAVALSICCLFLQTFDLKGSIRSRYVQTSGLKNDVLLDENLLESE